MPNYSISVDLAPLAQALTVTGNEIVMRISQAVAATAQAGYERWAEGIMKADGVWSKEKQEYAESIKVRSINAFEAEIWSDYKNAAAIETGRPAKDLKRMLDTSMRVRISAKGARYLIIPFRHNTPGHDAHADAMPQHIYAAAKSLAPSSVAGQGVRLSGLNAYLTASRMPMIVPQNIYQWGGRLKGGMAPKLKPEHHSDPFAGMVRVKTSTGGHQHMTFRVMSERSSGWIVPAKPGLFIARRVTEELSPLFERAIQEAVKISLPI